MIDPETGEVIPSVFKDFTIDEISAVDRPAQPNAKVSIMKRATVLKQEDEEEDALEAEDEGVDKGKTKKGGKKPKKGEPGYVGKRAFLTTATDGHQHLLTDEVGPEERGAAGQTSFEDGHSHPWIMNIDTGAITIGMANGHTHEMALNGADGAPPGVIDLSPGTGLQKQAEDGTPEPANASKSTSGDSTADQVGNVQKEDTMSDKNDKTVTDPAVAKQLEDLQKANERLQAVSELSDGQRAIFKSLDVEKQDEFLALTPEQRDAQVAKAAEDNAVVFEDQGVEYRKNDDPRLVALAKQAKADREARVEAEKRATESDLRKRAEELKHIPGDVEVRMSILKGIDALPEDQRGPALEALKAQDAELGVAFERVGTSVTPSEVNPLDGIAKGILEKDPNLTPEQAMAKALETPEGEAAYAKSLGL